MSPYLRTVKTSSGATAVQIVHSSRRGSRDIGHFGSAHDEAELELADGGRAAAARRIVSEVRVKFKVAMALATAAVCAAVVSCSSGPAATATTHAPPVTVLTKGADNGNGDIFLAPSGGQYGAGPEIVSITGKVLWFHRLPAGAATPR